MYTRQRLAGDFAALGVEAGDILFVHSSFKSLGPVKGNARTVVAALEDAVGPEGLVLMPSFHLVWRDPSNPPPPEVAADPGLAERYRLRQGRAELWDHATTPSIGRLADRVLPAHARQLPLRPLFALGRRPRQRGPRRSSPATSRTRG